MNSRRFSVHYISKCTREKFTLLLRLQEEKKRGGEKKKRREEATILIRGEHLISFADQTQREGRFKVGIRDISCDAYNLAILISLRSKRRAKVERKYEHPLFNLECCSLVGTRILWRPD